MNLELIVLIAFLSVATALARAQTPAQEKASMHTSAEASAAPAALRAVPVAEEDWTALPLAKSGLNPEVFNAVLLAKVEEKDFTRELIRVEWRVGDPIELSIVLPHGVERPPVILYLYDYTSDTDRFRSESWCRQVTQGGFAAVGFVSALSGQRFHAPRPMKEWFVSEMQEALGTSTHDVQMVLNYLAQRDDLDAKTVGMLGQGSGGAVAVLAAAVDSRIVALDLINPWGDWPEWVKGSRQIPENERAMYLKPEFLQRVSALDPVDYLPKLKLKALRVQQIMDDLVTPPAAKDKIAAAVPKPEEIARYKDTSAHVKEWRENGLSGWLREQLRPSADIVSKVQLQ